MAALAGGARSQGVWAQTPTADDFMNAYRPAKTDGSTEGVVQVRCKVAAGGDLSDCTVVSEMPAGSGFGPAALTLMPKFRAGNREADGWRRHNPHPLQNQG